VEPKVMLSASIAYATTDYLDSPFHARTLTCGVGAIHDIADDLSLGIDVAYAKGSLISGDGAQALVITSSITKRFSAKPAGTKQQSGRGA